MRKWPILCLLYMKTTTWVDRKDLHMIIYLLKPEGSCQDGVSRGVCCFINSSSTTAKVDAQPNTESLPQLWARVIVALCSFSKQSKASFSPPSSSWKHHVSESMVPLWDLEGLSLLGCTGVEPHTFYWVITLVKQQNVFKYSAKKSQ